MSSQEYLNKTMEKWEKRDMKRDSKKRFKDFKNNVKSVQTLWEVSTKFKREENYNKAKKEYENDNEE